MTSLDLDLFEKVIVYNCLKKGNEEYLASSVEHLEPDLFSNRDASAVIGLIRDFYLEHNVIPNRTEIKLKIVNNTLRDSFAKLIEEFKTIDKEYTPDELIKNTETFVKQRLFKKMLETAIEEHTTDRIIDEERSLKDFNKIQAVSLFDNLGMDFFEDTDTFVDRLQQKENFISTGYRWLDVEFGGGLHKEGKSIYCVGGETNIGKSIVLGNIATNVLLQSYNVVIITLEMSEFRYAKRIASMLTGIASMELSSKTDEYVEYVTTFSGEKQSRLYIKEFPTKQASAKHVASYLKKLERKKGFVPDVIITDYHTLLKPSIPQGSKHADMQFTTQETRALSYVFPAPVLTAAQLNRGEGDVTAPQLNRISGSWDMMGDFDYFVSIWQTDEDRMANLIRWAVKKARDSEKNVNHFWNIDYSTLKLKDEDAEDLATAALRDDKMVNIIDDLKI